MKMYIKISKLKTQKYDLFVFVCPSGHFSSFLCLSVQSLGTLNFHVHYIVMLRKVRNHTGGKGTFGPRGLHTVSKESKSHDRPKFAFGGVSMLKGQMDRDH